ncbi:hypothetical protein [Streptosporangium sp. 'caverna']|uniref:hypothetical protein n=1 Tax=Streptosporangium sp. 'caverna' TaxID=2202249 RepID=UPI000D7D698A|nr:hypothetical protein [Streptosporangium sp. 'caverna']AWS45005.1 hypothetical protein DKM19_30515 [Streptosporangium sp. 'caverna']
MRPGLLPVLEWTRYVPRGNTSRVRAFIVRGAVEYELCAEGGQMVIRRTVLVISEAARGRVSDAQEIWKAIASA